MTKLAKDFYTTMIKVVEVRGKHHFDLDGVRLVKIDAALFVSKQRLSSLPVVVFHGKSLEYSKDRAPFCITGHGAENVSVSVFQHDLRTARSVLRGKHLEAKWFTPGDTLVILGHARPVTGATLKKEHT